MTLQLFTLAALAVWAYAAHFYTRMKDRDIAMVSLLVISAIIIEPMI